MTTYTVIDGKSVVIEDDRVLALLTSLEARNRELEAALRRGWKQLVDDYSFCAFCPGAGYYRPSGGLARGHAEGCIVLTLEGVEA